MPDTIQDEIYRNLIEASRRQAAEIKEAGHSLADLILQAGQIRAGVAQETARGADAARAFTTKTTRATQESEEHTVLSEVFGVFKSGLGFSPLVKGLFSMFGGGGEESAA